MPDINNPKPDTNTPNNSPSTQPKKTEVVKDIISKRGRTISGSKPDEIIFNPVLEVKQKIDSNFSNLVLSTAAEEIGKIYDEVVGEAYDEDKENAKIKSVNHTDTHDRDDGKSERTLLYKNDTPGEPKSSKVKEDINNTFEAWVDDINPDPKHKEVVNRHGQDRKKIQLVPRDKKDRKEDDRPYRHQEIQKKIIDEQPEVSFGKGPPDLMSSPANDLKKQQLKLPKVTMPDFKPKSSIKLPNVNDFTPDMFKSEAYGKGYVSPEKKIRNAMAQRGINIDSDEHAKENERLKARYQAILDKEAEEKEKKKETSESVNSAGSGGVRGFGNVSGSPDGESNSYTGQNIADADTRDNIIKAHINQHFSLHMNDTKKVAKEEKEVWDKPAPKGKHGKMTPAQVAKAKARARAAGRPYPNLVDNMAAMKEEKDPVSHLEDKLNTATDKSYNGIDKIMRGIAKEHNIDVHDLHDMWVKKTGITPDQYVKEENYATVNEMGKKGTFRPVSPGVQNARTAQAATRGDKALDKEYHYGTTKGGVSPIAGKRREQGFGAVANYNSAQSALTAKKQGANPKGQDAAIHKGWGKTVDQMPAANPEKQAARKKLQQTPFSSLSKGEQEKDTVLRRGITKEAKIYFGKNRSKYISQRKPLSPEAENIIKAATEKMKDKAVPSQSAIERRKSGNTTEYAKDIPSDYKPKLHKD